MEHGRGLAKASGLAVASQIGIPLHPKRLVQYFTLQGAAIGAWWLLLVISPDSRAWFSPPSFGDAPLFAFWLADAMAAFASFATAALIVRGSPLRVPLAWFTAGSMAYAALYCVAQLAVAEAPWFPAAMMVPAGVLSTGGAWIVTRP